MPEWIDKALEIEKFHKHKVASYGKCTKWSRSSKNGWSVRDTARALKLSVGKVSEDLKLAKFVHEKRGVARDIDERKDALEAMKKWQASLNS